ncbi:MAG TPA: hypothetical protein PLP14_07040, partial [Chitinophagaceae bacterium]|nr:hypothetical protein [Chitinophagaceae bacterium]
MIPWQSLLAQKQIDQVIPDAEKRKVVRARKLYNQFEIARGEQILKNLVREHKEIPYYHEALVQMQRQVLRLLPEATEQYRNWNHTQAENQMDENADTTYAIHQSMEANQKPLRKDSVEWDGFDPGKRNVDIKKIKHEEPQEEEILTDAVVTIDSSLLEDDTPVEQNLAQSLNKEKDLKKKLKALNSLNEIPIESYTRDLIQNCRYATLMTPYADSASKYLKEYLIDTLQCDSAMKPDVRSLYEAAWEAYQDEDWTVALQKVNQALELDKGSYALNLLSGDIFFRMGQDSLSIHAYSRTLALFPFKTEPPERLSTLYESRGRYREAASDIISAIMVYPQQHFFQSLSRIAVKSGKKFSLQWIPREVYPLDRRAQYFPVTAKESSPWWFYQQSEAELTCCTDSNGIIQPNEKTT